MKNLTNDKLRKKGSSGLLIRAMVILFAVVFMSFSFQRIGIIYHLYTAHHQLTTAEIAHSDHHHAVSDHGHHHDHGHGHSHHSHAHKDHDSDINTAAQTEAEAPDSSNSSDHQSPKNNELPSPEPDHHDHDADDHKIQIASSFSPAIQFSISVDRIPFQSVTEYCSTAAMTTQVTSNPRAPPFC